MSNDASDLSTWKRLAADAEARRPQGPQTTADRLLAQLPDSDLPDGFKPTPRMIFARWLVQTGKLNEWNV